MTAAKRVLVVDDQEDIREMARLILTGAGYEVYTAASGREALAAVRQSQFDLMLLDINMPELDGWATLRLMRADAAHDAMPVAMFSVKSEVRDKVASLQDGAIDYITKPFGVDDLVFRVSRIFSAADGAPAVPTASPR
jgi:DNA-binding response OmpR family regulator